MHVVTAYVWDARSVLRAETVQRLARQLYLLCPWWSHESADDIAGRLARGQVVLLPSYEAAFIPGEVELAVSVPVVEVEGWRPSWADER
jgi:hypothetical protein